MSEQRAPADLPKLAARAVLIDMDGTVTPTIAHGDYMARVLCELTAQRHDLSADRAETMVRSVFDLGNEPIRDTYLDSLQIGFDEYWQAVLAWQDAHFTAFEDAVSMIRELHDMGVRMYPATSNAGLSCRAKLAGAGLAEQSGASHFTELFGGSEVCARGKGGPDFFTALLEKIECEPDEVVAVGDDVQADLAAALAAGIRQVVIVRRDQAPEWERGPSGGLFVKSLALVPAMLTPIPACQ